MRVAVCVPSHERPLRLRWLLNALAEQDRPPDEVVVAFDDPPGGAAHRLLAEHPVVTRAIHLPPCGPARKRNAAWRSTGCEVVVFTDDDCRPPPGWLAALDPPADAIAQGATRPDPDEAEQLSAVRGRRTQDITPPTPWGETANISYPRALLERLGGFDEALPVAAGEDTDLLCRATAAGARVVARPEAVTWHAVEVLPLASRVRQLQRWRHVALVVKRHPRLRRHLVAGVVLRERHAHLLLAAATAAAAAARPSPARAAAAAAAAVRYGRRVKPSYGGSPGGRVRAWAEVPLEAVEDAAYVVALARGSVEHRTLVL